MANLKSGLYRHHSGSELDLTVHEGGRLSGQYRTAGGRPGLKKWFPLVGRYNGDLLGFCVSWGEYHSLTSWSGRFYMDADGNETIRTQWLLARKYADKALTEENAPWESFLAGSDKYILVKQG